MRIIHLTSVHNWNDDRIFHKECKTLSNQGYDVVLIAVADKEMTVDGIRIIPLPRIGNKIKRMFVNSFLIMKQSIKVNGNIYHFHDPELVFIGLILRVIGKHVIYDIHENIVEVIKGRSYWSNNIKKWLPTLAGMIEKWASQFFHLVIAGNFLDERYPNATKLLNYSNLIKTEFNNEKKLTIDQGKKGLVYTGFVTERRGALIYADIAKNMPEVPLHLIGEVRPLELLERLTKIAGANTNLIIDGKGNFVDPIRKDNLVRNGNWFAALCIFPYSIQYLNTEPTKFFDYMSYGIPIVCSNFPVWKDFIEKEQCGLTVDPGDIDDIRDKINYLSNNIEAGIKMGENGRKAVNEKYNWNNESKKLIELYNNIYSSNN